MRNILLLLALVATTTLSTMATTKSITRDTIQVMYHTNYESGSFRYDSINRINLKNTLLTILNSIGHDDLEIETTITSSTDDQQPSIKLRRKLSEYGYDGDNFGLSNIRNDKVADAIQTILFSNGYESNFSVLDQVVEYEKGKGLDNRTVRILFKFIGTSLSKEVLKNKCNDCDSISYIESQLQISRLDSLSKLHGCRVYLKRKEYTAYRKYSLSGGNYHNEKTFKGFSNDVLNEVRYIEDFEDLTKLKLNTSLHFRKIFTKRLLVGSLFIGGGVLCFWNGAMKHPIYRNKFEYINGVNTKINDSELTAIERTYYKGINSKAKRVSKQRKQMYVIGGVLSLIGSVFIYEAFVYRRLSIQVGSANGVVGLKYQF